MHIYSIRFRLETATETEEVDVKPNFSVFMLFSVATLKTLVANHKTIKFDAEGENNRCLITMQSCCTCKLYIGTHLLVILNCTIINHS